MKFALLPSSLCTDAHSCCCELLHLNWDEGHLIPSQLSKRITAIQTGKEGRVPTLTHRDQERQSNLLDAAEMQQVDVKTVLKGEGQGENMTSETEDSRRKERTDYWEEWQKGYWEQSLGLGRQVKTPRHPLVPYLWRLSTASLFAKAARSIFQVQWATWLPKLFNETEFISINFHKRSQKEFWLCSFVTERNLIYYNSVHRMNEQFSRQQTGKSKFKYIP